MEHYRFLLKPSLFILFLVVSSWLTLEIEHISPNDFSKHPSFLKSKPKPVRLPPESKQYLITICNQYKQGLIDSITLDSILSPNLPIKELKQKIEIASPGFPDFER